MGVCHGANDIDGSLDTSFGAGGTVITQVLSDDYYSVAVALETINSQTMIVDAGTAALASNNPQDFGLVRYTPNGSLDSNTPAVKFAALRGSGLPKAPVPMGILPGNLRAGLSPAPLSIGTVSSVSPAGTTILDAGLVLQALDSTDFLDTLRPGRRRR